MADQFDIASEREELFRKLDIERALKAPKGPVHTGACHFCAEPVEAPKRWCDEHCRSDWEKEQEAKKRAGK